MNHVSVYLTSRRVHFYAEYTPSLRGGEEGEAYPELEGNEVYVSLWCLSAGGPANESDHRGISPRPCKIHIERALKQHEETHRSLIGRLLDDIYYKGGWAHGADNLKIHKVISRHKLTFCVQQAACCRGSN